MNKSTKKIAAILLSLGVSAGGVVGVSAGLKNRNELGTQQNELNKKLDTKIVTMMQTPEYKEYLYKCDEDILNAYNNGDIDSAGVLGRMREIRLKDNVLQQASKFMSSRDYVEVKRDLATLNNIDEKISLNFAHILGSWAMSFIGGLGAALNIVDFKWLNKKLDESEKIL